MSIGVFDSGFGGLSVMRAIQQRLPEESIIYFGDTARLPYGNKSAEAIRRYCMENTSFLIAQGIKLLVIACNTACACALEGLQNSFSLPIVGVILPGVEAVAELENVRSMAILGTERTIEVGVHKSMIEKRLPTTSVTGIACPLLVPLVEEGYFDHPLTRLVIHEYLAPLKGLSIDTLLLACTHYPFLAEAIQHEMGPNVRLVDPAKKCSEEVERVLIQMNAKATGPAKQHFFVSDDPEKFRLLGKSFLCQPIEIVGEII